MKCFYTREHKEALRCAARNIYPGFLIPTFSTFAKLYDPSQLHSLHAIYITTDYITAVVRYKMSHIDIGTNLIPWLDKH